MLLIPVPVPTVNDILKSLKLGWTEIYCAGSKCGDGGYNPLILYQCEIFSEQKSIFFKFIQN